MVASKSAHAQTTDSDVNDTAGNGRGGVTDSDDGPNSDAPGRGRGSTTGHTDSDSNDRAGNGRSGISDSDDSDRAGYGRGRGTGR